MKRTDILMAWYLKHGGGTTPEATAERLKHDGWRQRTSELRSESEACKLAFKGRNSGEALLSFTRSDK